MSLSIETNKDRILPVSCELTSVSKDAGLLVTSNNYNQTYEQELKDCIEILIKKPDDIETLVKKAKLLIRLNRLQKAVDCFDRVLAICPADFESRLNKANALNQLERFDEALKCIDECILYHFINQSVISLAYKCKGVLFRQMNDYQQALSFFDKSISADPTNFETIANKSAILTELGRHEEAIKFSDQILSSSLTRLNIDETQVILNNKGISLMENNRIEEAIQTFKKSIEMLPITSNTREIIEALVSQTNCLVKAKKYADALLCINRLIEIYPNDKIFWRLKGEQLKYLEKYELALEAFSKAISIDSKFREALIDRADCLTLLKKYDQAITAYDQALKLCDKDKDKFVFDYLVNNKKYALQCL